MLLTNIFLIIIICCIYNIIFWKAQSPISMVFGLVLYYYQLEKGAITIDMLNFTFPE